MHPWPERDEVLLGQDRWEILNWSNKQTPVITWPGCTTRFHILLSLAITLTPTATEQEKAEALQLLRNSGCKVLDNGRVDTLFGILRLNPLLKLA